jgi:ribosomal protein L32
MSICPKNKSSKGRRDKRRVCKKCGSYNKKEIIEA